MEQKVIIESIINSLQKEISTSRALVGLDGYIDQIKKVIKSKDADKTVYYENLKDFAERINYAAGKSAQFEMHLLNKKIGGNAPIMANALAKLKFNTTCLGALGLPIIHSLFNQIPAQLISIGQPANTDALEFDDGKLMLSDLSSFEEIDWNHLQTVIGIPQLVNFYSNHPLIALVGLSNLPHITDILKNLYTHVASKIEDHKPHFFFDLADPSRLTKPQIIDLLEAIDAFKNCGEVTLGVNENEALYVFKMLGGVEDTGSSLESKAQYIFKSLSIDKLLVHPIDSVYLISSDHECRQEGRLVKSPKVLTGAGDNLNAGYCFGHSIKLTHDASLMLGMAQSGAYISLGYSPDKNEILDYLKRWQKEL